VLNPAPVPLAPGEAGTAWWRPAPPASAERADAPLIPEPRNAESALPFRGLLLFTFILLISPQAIVPALAPLRIALLAVGVTVLGLVGDRLRRGQPLSVRTNHLALALALLGWTVVTIPFSLWPGGSVQVLQQVFARSLVIFWLLANVLTTPARMRRLAWVLAILSMPIAVAAVQNYLRGGFLQGTRVQRIVGYEAPLTSNPNDLALMLNLLIPIIAALFLVRRSRWEGALLLVALGLAVAAIVATFSRAGFITLVVIALAYAWKLRGRPEQRVLAFALAAAVVCLPLLPAGYADRLSSIVRSDEDRSGSAQARQADTWAAMRVVAEHPVVGAGIGNDILALNRERGVQWTAVHNVYLQHAVDLGLPGLALFVLLLRACLRSARRVERAAVARPATRELGALAAGIHVSLIAFAVAAAFHPVSYHFYFYYIAGMSVALEAIGRSSGLLVARAAR